MCSSGRLAALALCLAAVWAVGCGHKESPKPPPQRIPQPVRDLAVAQRGERLTFTFTYPQTTISGLPIDDIVAIELWELELPVPDFVVGDAGEDGPDPDETGTIEGGEGDGASAGAEDAASAPGDPESATGEEREESGEPDPEPESDQGAPSEPSSDDDPGPEPPPGDEDEGDGDDDREPTVSKESLLEVDPRQFEAGASKRITLEGDDLTNAIRGDQVELEVTLDAIEPGETQALVYAVKSFQTLNRASAFSNLARIVPRVTPAPPSSIELAAEPNGVQVSWSFEGDEPQEFRIYRRDPLMSGFGPHHGTQDGDEDKYLDSRAELGSSYVYAMTAVVNRTPLVESALSSEHEIEYLDAFPPDPPTDLVALSEVGAARLLWEASSAEDLAGYVVYRRSQGVEWAALAEISRRRLEYTDSTAASGRVYAYRVVAVDQHGNQSDPSEEVQVRIP